MCFRQVFTIVWSLCAGSPSQVRKDMAASIHHLYVRARSRMYRIDAQSKEQVRISRRQHDV
jgi:hypothetical protein